MLLKLMYITNNPDIAQIAERAGVDRIFVDMEYIGKSLRQGGMNTVQSNHTTTDVQNIRKVLKSAQLLVRCNPVHDATTNYSSTENEIDSIIACGADIIMLPYFKTAAEVNRFLNAVNGRARTMLLFESPESIENIDSILSLKGIDEVYIGLNDLSLGYKKKFMFQLLSEGTVEKICRKFAQKGLPYGFGGFAAVGTGALPAENIIMEHYRLGSTCAILSRGFCDIRGRDLQTIHNMFTVGIKNIREHEAFCEKNPEKYSENHQAVVDIVNSIADSL